ncbi:MAG: hypothetical protein U1C74_26460 [Phenylobacterium sp.]|nr:hypothetical protein [Phenylobacterium sp.]
MTSRTCKLGLVLPEGLHDRMVDLAVGPGGDAPRRGPIQAVYQRAFVELLQALDAGEPVAFAAVRGAKARVTLRLPETVCAKVRARLGPLNLKLTDFAYAAVDRLLSPTQGV